MAKAAWEIDRIVREVIRRLRDGAGGPNAVEMNRGQTESATATVSTPPQSPGDLRVEDRVVSLAAVDGRLEGMRRLITRRDAVITPSVRDEIRERGIELVRGGGSETDSIASPRSALAVVGEASSQLIGALVPLFDRVDRFVDGDLVTAIQRLARGLRDHGGVGVLVTTQPAAAQHLAGRVEAVRLTLAVDERTVREATEMIGANLLVVDAQRRDATTAASLVRQFIATPHRACPGDLARMIERMR